MRRDELAGEEALEILGERARVVVATLAIVGERLVDDRRELGRHAGDELARAACGGAVDRGAHHLVGAVLRVVRRLAREQVVERRAERVDIAALVDRRAAQLLGRHEAGRAEHDAGAGLDVVVVVIDERPSGSPRVGVLVGLADHLREAPVDHDGLAELADEDVRRLDVAMDDAALVRVRDRVRRGDDVRNEREPLARASRRAADQLLERAARRSCASRRTARRLGDARRRGPARSTGCSSRAVIRVSRWNRRSASAIERERFLERDGAAEHGVGRLDDAAHAAARDLGRRSS